MKVVLKNVSKSFAGHDVLKGIDLTVKSGESFVILGGSGAGKSVLLSSIALMNVVSNGDIYFDEKILSATKEKDVTYLHNSLGFLFQDVGLFDSMTLWENVAFFHMHAVGLEVKSAKEMAIKKLEQLGIATKFANYMPSEISGGLQKRVGLARMFMKNPGLMLIDEPTSGLDPIVSASVANTMKFAMKQSGATAITITHDISVCKAIADRVGLFHNGKFIWVAKMDDFFNSGNRAVENFIHGKPIDS